MVHSRNKSLRYPNDIMYPTAEKVKTLHATSLPTNRVSKQKRKLSLRLAGYPLNSAAPNAFRWQG